MRGLTTAIRWDSTHTNLTLLDLLNITCRRQERATSVVSLTNSLTCNQLTMIPISSSRRIFLAEPVEIKVKIDRTSVEIKGSIDLTLRGKVTQAVKINEDGSVLKKILQIFLFHVAMIHHCCYGTPLLLWYTIVAMIQQCPGSWRYLHLPERCLISLRSCGWHSTDLE